MDKINKIDINELVEEIIAFPKYCKLSEELTKRNWKDYTPTILIRVIFQAEGVAEVGK